MSNDPQPTRTAICTIVSKNYLAHARTLLASVRPIHPDWQPYVLLVDEVDENGPSAEGFTVISLDQLALPNSAQLCFRYTILELNTAVKPWFFEYLFHHCAMDRVVYLDPDIHIYAPLREVEQLCDQGALMVLTPHLTGELNDDKHPQETDILRSGAYNLGFLALARHQELGRFLDWWKRRLEFDCRIDLENGLFVDQKWMDLVPGLFSDVCILRHEGYNVAYWNLNHRPLRKSHGRYTVNGQPLVFLHFSGLNPEFPSTISRHQNRIGFAEIGDARELFLDYVHSLQRHGLEASRAVPYAFGQLRDGTPIPRAMRHFYRTHPEMARSLGADPFAHTHEYLNEPWGSRSSPLITRLMRQIWESRPDLRAAFPDIDGAWRLSYIHAFLDAVAREEEVPTPFIRPVQESLARLSHDERAREHLQAAVVAPGDDCLSPSAMTAVFRRLLRWAMATVPLANNRQRLLQLYHFLRPWGRWLPESFRHRLRRELQHWWRQRAALQSHHPLGMWLPRPPSPTEEAAEQAEAAALEPDQEGTLKFPARESVFGAPTRGINIVGYHRSEHGIGESARRSVHAAEAVGLPVAAIEFNTGNVCRTEDDSMTDRLGRSNPYSVNLFHVNADQLAVARRELGAAFGRDRYNVGFWHWELPDFPDRWCGAFDLVDEVWAPTRFVQEALTRKSPVPVVRMPHCIEFDVSPNCSRGQFGLPQDDFVFLTMFDCLSIQERKNPEGTLTAFQTAFGGQRGVTLVVKVNNGAQAPAEMAALRRRVGGLTNVVLLDRCLSRQEVHDLEAVCDAFVSLHRSEGFGLGLAECMYLGKPVVGTNWSGNTDFMTATNSCPVRHRLVKLEQNYGPYEAGQQWAEPDLAHAASCLVRLVEDPAWRDTIGWEARKTIRSSFSPAAIGALYQHRLRVIEAMMDRPRRRALRAA